MQIREDYLNLRLIMKFNTFLYQTVKMFVMSYRLKLSDFFAMKNVVTKLNFLTYVTNIVVTFEIDDYLNDKAFF